MKRIADDVEAIARRMVELGLGQSAPGQLPLGQSILVQSILVQSILVQSAAIHTLGATR